MQENKHSPLNATHSFIHSFIHFIQSHQSITRFKRPDGYRIGQNALYFTLIHKLNL